MICVRSSGKGGAFAGWWGMRGWHQGYSLTYWTRNAARAHPRDGVALIIRRDA